ncbi:coiled-coil domain-containing protein 173 isoform X2 [Scyliorhinus canicula]|uniref:coiled-coil domain-containing protein 173 isoform X2 n=1 Tax=Scyliorhinus canicula TaxID=7830 RepID=UPI0018F3F978|nr:coiled-coil domain-containing protein 173 isoform X2 [Scyliorhinus canicula]
MASNLTSPNRRSASTRSSGSTRISSAQNANECVPWCHEVSDLGKVNAQINDKPNDSGGLHFPNLVDLRQVTVLPKAEWQRIQGDLNGINREADLIRTQMEEREILHLRSKEVTKNWTNTIAGQRQKRLDAGKLRKEKEEAEKKQIDIEEAKYMAQKRKENLERAKTLLFYQTDRVKGFNAALMLTETLKEREAQIELKRKKINLIESEERSRNEEMQRRLNMGEDEEYKKIIKQKEKRKSLADFQEQQIKENERVREQEKQQYIKEGEEIKKLANLYQWELNKIEQLKAQEKHNNMLNHRAYIANINIIKALEKQKEELEDEDIRLFVSAKQKILKLRKQKQAEIDREKEDHRKLMVKIISEQIKEEVEDEMHRIAKAAEEMEAKRDMEIKEKEQKQKADLKAIEEYRIMMMKVHEEKEKEAKIQAKEVLHAKMEADYLHHEQENKKKLKAREENGGVQSFLVEQMAEKKAKALRNRAAVLEHEQKSMALLEIEKQQFEKYAQQVIDATAKKGRNVYPLIKAANQGIGGGRGPVFTEKGGIRPSYQVKDTSGVQLPNYKRSTTEAVKNIHDKCDIERSKKSLGFIW